MTSARVGWVRGCGSSERLTGRTIPFKSSPNRPPLFVWMGVDSWARSSRVLGFQAGGRCFRRKAWYSSQRKVASVASVPARTPALRRRKKWSG